MAAMKQENSLEQRRADFDAARKYYGPDDTSAEAAWQRRISEELTADEKAKEGLMDSIFNRARNMRDVENLIKNTGIPEGYLTSEEAEAVRELWPEVQAAKQKKLIENRYWWKKEGE
jgi:hypothetical protein